MFYVLPNDHGFKAKLLFFVKNNFPYNFQIVKIELESDPTAFAVCAPALSPSLSS